MTIGHPNAGYAEIISKHKLALNNPKGTKTGLHKDMNDLKEIREAAKKVWSAKDNNQTTYGHYHQDHKQELSFYRPSSPERKNKPHPSKVFLTARMSHIPGYFDDNDFDNRRKPRINIPNFPNIEHNDILLPNIKRYANTNEYFQTLNTNEAEQVESQFKDNGLSASYANLNYIPTRSYMSYDNINHENKNSLNFQSQSELTGPSEYQAEYEGKSSADEIDGIQLKKTGEELQSNSTNPFLYNDYRVYREKYTLSDHGVPNPHSKKNWPSRGDFSIHPDWHCRLKHHRLPYEGTRIY